MPKSDVQVAREIVGAFVEECGADAVVIIYSKVKRRKTETYLVPFGNAHTCNALIDYAYENYEPPFPAEEVKESEDDDD